MQNSLDKTQELATRPIGQLLWVYALPAVISQIIASVYSICDRIFLGQYVGALAIAGLSITMPIMNIIHAFGSLVGAGSSARMSIVLGRGDHRWAEKILGNSMLLTFILGFIFLVGSYAFLDQILTMFGASEETISYADQYMRIVLPGMFLTTLTFNLTGLIRATGYPTKSMLIMVTGAVLNIVLDAIFICVLGWGISGAAWATTISMAVGSIWAVTHFVSKKSFVRFQKHAWAPKLYIFRNILAIGISPFSMNIAASLVVALLNKQLIRFGGDLAVGAYGIVNTFASFIVMFILGLCMGMQPIAGYNYGAGKTDRLKQVYWLAMKCNVLCGTIGAILACSIPAILLRAFTNEQSLIEIGVPAMRYLIVMFPVIGYTITNSQFFQSIDKPWIAIVTSLSRQVIFLIPMIYIVPAIFLHFNADGLTGVWVACTICDLLGAILAWALYLTQRAIFKPGYVAPDRRPRKELGPKDDFKDTSDK